MPFLEIARKSHGVVVFLILGRVEQRHTRRLPKEIEERVESLGSAIELFRIATAELLPPLGIVAKPAPEFRARREFPEPVVDGGRLFAKPAWPEPIDEDTDTVPRVGLVVHTAHADSHVALSGHHRSRANGGNIAREG